MIYRLIIQQDIEGKWRNYCNAVIRQYKFAEIIHGHDVLAMDYTKACKIEYMQGSFGFGWMEVMMIVAIK